MKSRIMFTKNNTKRKPISEMSVGIRSEVRATLVQAFETKPIFEVCPECGKRTISRWKNEFICTY